MIINPCYRFASYKQSNFAHIPTNVSFCTADSDSNVTFFVVDTCLNFRQFDALDVYLVPSQDVLSHTFKGRINLDCVISLSIVSMTIRLEDSQWIIKLPSILESQRLIR